MQLRGQTGITYHFEWSQSLGILDLVYFFLIHIKYFNKLIQVYKTTHKSINTATSATIASFSNAHCTVARAAALGCSYQSVSTVGHSHTNARFRAKRIVLPENVEKFITKIFLHKQSDSFSCR